VRRVRHGSCPLVVHFSNPQRRLFGIKEAVATEASCASTALALALSPASAGSSGMADQELNGVTATALARTAAELEHRQAIAEACESHSLAQVAKAAGVSKQAVHIMVKRSRTEQSEPSVKPYSSSLAGLSSWSCERFLTASESEIEAMRLRLEVIRGALEALEVRAEETRSLPAESPPRQPG
jgi:transposase